MAERAKLIEPKDHIEEIKNPKLQFFSSGSTLLDLALGGGWPLSRVVNIVGDRSSGKSLLAIEAFANFSRVFPKGKMRYAETEAAFDEEFAKTLGFPESVERPEELLDTVEEFQDDLKNFASKGGPSLYILDSLDALSDTAELDKAEENAKARAAGKDEKGSFGASKAKKMSELFRIVTRTMGNKDCTLIVISQIRDNIGVTWGETKTRSGGRALDFFSSTILWLAEVEKIKRTVLGQERVTGVRVAANCKKSKIGLPFRKVEFQILFNFGIDDQNSMLDWLEEFDWPKVNEIKKSLKTAREKQDYATLKQIDDELKTETIARWTEIDDELNPKIRKYV